MQLILHVSELEGDHDKNKQFTKVLQQSWYYWDKECHGIAFVRYGKLVLFLVRNSF